MRRNLTKPHTIMAIQSCADVVGVVLSVKSVEIEVFMFDLPCFEHYTNAKSMTYVAALKKYHSPCFSSLMLLCNSLMKSLISDHLEISAILSPLVW